MLGEFYNRTCMRQAYDCDKGLDKAVSDKVRLWVRHNIIFFNDLVGIPNRRKSKAIYKGITSRDFQCVLRNENAC